MNRRSTLKPPIVSILVITYNQKDLMSETLASCLNQTIDDYEIVVSDDGSTDGTQHVLESIQRLHPEKIRLVLNPVNQGITANCNAGLAACNGRYVALMGGDDLLLPRKLERQLSAFLENPRLVLSYHPCHVMRNGTIAELVGGRAKDIVKNQIDMIGNFGAQLPGPATMVRADAIPHDGFNSEIRTASDWMYFIDVTSQGDVERIDEPLAIYRQQGGNVGHRYFSYSDDFLKTLEITSRKYGNRPGVQEAVRRGGKRFVLGIVYRAVEHGELCLARVYAKQLTAFSSKHLSRAVTLATWIPGVTPVFRRSKSLLKRFI
ncbi:glycosyltransferase [Cryobacterium sp. TMS1-20-1]|uniref:glycosyltransferase family 2 protein n=1 Tax=Cryobacterium sp. TMS1-20-1 TaxID=1259223 RepID=UPI00106B8C9D|nr:glycosyltransferase [Cryobacterium sp. TMS1-20-1]TFC70735.1 glycosyltransferase [Cryobacterium sp. TMS1-20-1]